MMTPLKILYICTHNRCRSALSEAITNQLGRQDTQSQDTSSPNALNTTPKLIAKSAGSAPAGEVHPLTLKYLRQAGYSINGLSSNAWDDKAYMGDFEPDLLITVCDNAAGESCPIWLGSLPNLVKLHWGLADPSKNTTDESQTQQNFETAIAIIEQRVQQLLSIVDLPECERKQALLDLKLDLNT